MEIKNKWQWKDLIIVKYLSNLYCLYYCKLWPVHSVSVKSLLINLIYYIFFFISAPEPTSWPTFYYYLVQKLDSNISTGTTVQIYRNYFICFIIPVINNPKALVRIKSPAFCFLCDITEIGFMSKTGCTYKTNKLYLHLSWLDIQMDIHVLNVFCLVKYFAMTKYHKKGIQICSSFLKCTALLLETYPVFWCIEKFLLKKGKSQHTLKWMSV